MLEGDSKPFFKFQSLLEHVSVYPVPTVPLPTFVIVFAITMSFYTLIN